MKQLFTLLFICTYLGISAQIAPLFDHSWRLDKVVIDDEEIIATQAVGSTEFEDWAHIYFYEEGFSFVWLHTSLSFDDDNSSFVIDDFVGDLGSYHGAPSTMKVLYDFFYADIGQTNSLDVIYTYAFREEDGSLFLDITNSNGDLASFFSTTLSNTNFKTIEFNLYPNPTSQYLSIETNQSEITSVEIYNLQGKLVLQHKSNQLTNIDVSQLNKGVHLVKVATLEGELTKKFIKK